MGDSRGFSAEFQSYREKAYLRIAAQSHIGLKCIHEAPQARSAEGAQRRRREAPKARCAEGAQRRRRAAPKARSAEGAKRRRREKGATIEIWTTLSHKGKVKRLEGKARWEMGMHLRRRCAVPKARSAKGERR